MHVTNRDRHQMVSWTQLSIIMAQGEGWIASPCKTCRAIMRKCACTPGEITHKNSQNPTETRTYVRNYGHKVRDCCAKTAREFAAASANQSKRLSALAPREAENTRDSQRCFSTVFLREGENAHVSPRWFFARCLSAVVLCEATNSIHKQQMTGRTEWNE